MPAHRRIRATLIVALAASLLTTITPAAHASVLTISGIVKNPAGGPINGAIVGDGGQSSISGADGTPGHYSLQELGFGTYELTASKQGMTSAVATVQLTAANPSAIRDFTLYYQSTLFVPDRYLSTAAGPDTIQVTLKTWTPYPGSCAKITDTRTGATSAMTHTGAEAGQQVWQYTPTLAAQTPEGTFTLTARVDVCASGTRIDTGPQPATYVVDNTAPAFDRPIPKNGSNTFLLQQNIVSGVVDAGSGIDGASVGLEIVDLGSDRAGPLQPLVAPAIVYDANARVVVAENAQLVAGHWHRAIVTISDRAGNVAQNAAEFKQSSFPVPATTVQIPALPGLDTGSQASPGLHRWEFSRVPFTLEGYDVALGATPGHAGYGWVPQVVSLGTARIRYWMTPGARDGGSPPDGVINPFLLPQYQPSGLEDRRVFQGVYHLDIDQSVTSLHVQRTTFEIPTVSVNLDTGIVDAELFMDPAVTAAPDACTNTTAAGQVDCIESWLTSRIDPVLGPSIEETNYCHWRSGRPYCETDYLVYYVSDDEARTMNGAEEDTRAAVMGGVPDSDCDQVCRVAESLPANVSVNLGNLVLDPLTGDWLEATNEAGINRLWSSPCVKYVECPEPHPPMFTIPRYSLPVIPEEYGYLCANWLNCDADAADENWSPDPGPDVAAAESTKEQCLDSAGNPVDPDDPNYAKKCRQLFKLSVFGWRVSPETEGPSKRPFLRSSFTVSRGYKNAEKDHLGVEWSDSDTIWSHGSGSHIRAVTYRSQYVDASDVYNCRMRWSGNWSRRLPAENGNPNTYRPQASGYINSSPSYTIYSGKVSNSGAPVNGPVYGSQFPQGWKTIWDACNGVWELKSRRMGAAVAVTPTEDAFIGKTGGIYGRFVHWNRSVSWNFDWRAAVVAAGTFARNKAAGLAAALMVFSPDTEEHRSLDFSTEPLRHNY